MVYQGNPAMKHSLFIRARFAQLYTALISFPVRQLPIALPNVGAAYYKSPYRKRCGPLPFSRLAMPPSPGALTIQP
jgi:hypothetical protein